MDDLQRFKHIISNNTVSTLLETYGLLFHYSYIGCDRPGDSKKMELIEIEILKRMGGNK